MDGSSFGDLDSAAISMVSHDEQICQNICLGVVHGQDGLEDRSGLLFRYTAFIHSSNLELITAIGDAFLNRHIFHVERCIFIAGGCRQCHLNIDAIVG